MALTLSDRLLPHYGARALTARRDYSKVPCAHVAAVAKKNLTDLPAVRPEDEALKFYFVNHAASVAASRAVGGYLGAEEAEVLRTYHAESAGMAARAFQYLLLICTREARHAQVAEGKKASFFKAFPDSAEWSLYNRGRDSMAVANRFMTTPPDCALGPYVESLVWQFAKFRYRNAYGGPKWAAIAEVLRDFVVGKTSAEMMLDTVWTLAHNTAPIFNKGMQYAGQNAGVLAAILDIQRSGQIPHAIEEAHVAIGGKATVLTGLKSKVDGLLGEKWWGDRSYVDWIEVERLGALKKYPQYIKAQISKYGGADPAVPIVKAPPGFQATPGPSFQIMPGLSVPILKRAA